MNTEMTAISEAESSRHFVGCESRLRDNEQFPARGLFEKGFARSATVSRSERRNDTRTH
jgi:hypothetical protein